MPTPFDRQAEFAAALTLLQCWDRHAELAARLASWPLAEALEFAAYYSYRDYHLEVASVIREVPRGDA